VHLKLTPKLSPHKKIELVPCGALNNLTPKLSPNNFGVLALGGALVPSGYPNDFTRYVLWTRKNLLISVPDTGMLCTPEETWGLFQWTQSWTQDFEDCGLGLRLGLNASLPADTAMVRHGCAYDDHVTLSCEAHAGGLQSYDLALTLHDFDI